MAILRLAFMGSPEFALPTLDALRAAGHEIAAVYTQPPRPAGRGHKERRSAVHENAAAHGLRVETPASLKDPAVQAAFAALGIDAAVVAAYGLILPKSILDAPRLGCLNVHASLLPRWRGAAPIQHALLAGDRESGVTIMRMDEGLDTGDILSREALAIGAATTGGDLHDALAALGARLIGPALDGLNSGGIEPKAQPREGVTHAPKFTGAERRLDWRRPAVELERSVRAFAPRPGAWFEASGERLAALAARVVEADAAAPGTVLDTEFTVACGEGALRIERLRRAGKEETDAAALLRGFEIPPGAVLPPAGGAGS